MSGKYPGRPRHVKHEPIVAAQKGQPPAWVVSCLDCQFSHDAHGLDGAEAISTIAPTHQRGHRLVAQSIDYGEGWSRDGRPLAGVPPSVGGHPLYHR